jgi:hypothetical protein
MKHYNTLQALTGAVNHDPDPEQHIIERSVRRHDEYETIAQGLCTTMSIISDQRGFTYAIGRRCFRNGREICTVLCRRKLSQGWAIGAVHVYKSRPYSWRSSVTNPRMGFKVLWRADYHNYDGCGPNYCCCFEPRDAYRNWMNSLRTTFCIASTPYYHAPTNTSISHTSSPTLVPTYM